MEDKLKKFYEIEKAKHDRYVEYNKERNLSLYTEEEIKLFDQSIRHTDNWLRKIKMVIDNTYDFDI